jgi:hypothetical protein
MGDRYIDSICSKYMSIGKRLTFGIELEFLKFKKDPAFPGIYISTRQDYVKTEWRKDDFCTIKAWKVGTSDAWSLRHIRSLEDGVIEYDLGLGLSGSLAVSLSKSQLELYAAANGYELKDRRAIS